MSADLEKRSGSAISSDSSAGSHVEASSAVSHLEPLRTTATNRSRRSIASHPSRRLDENEPLEALEHAAYSPAAVAVAESEAQSLHSLPGSEPIACTRTGASSHLSTWSRRPDFEVAFDTDDDPEDPRGWPIWYRVWVTVWISYSTWVIVLYSTAYTSTVSGLVEDFDTSETIATLGLTTYLTGLAVGSLVFAPLSELYGRQVVYLSCLGTWAVLIIPCGVAHSLTQLIVVRFFGALFGAAFVTNAPGSVVDISNPDYLALAMSLWSIAPLNGPVTGPLIGGFVFQYMGWRWTNWISLILGGVAIAGMATVKETYAPIILKRKAARLRREMGDDRYWCRYDTDISSLALIKTNLKRPLVLFATEPILWFMNFWISLIYGILYLCFVAYPVVFSQHRGWGPGLSGCAFLGIGIGIMIGISCEPLLRRLINAQPRDPETGRVKPESTALVMAIGGVLAPIGQLGFSWTCLPSRIPWVAPLAFGIPFGCGNTLSFIYGNNYIAASYGVYAASALAGNAVLRSLAGGLLPLAGPSMYAALSPQWAGTLLGVLEVLMIPIPFVFWRYGARIRAKSRVICQLREEQDRMDAKKERFRAAMERRAARAAAEGGKEGEGDKEGRDGYGVGESQIQGAERKQEGYFQEQGVLYPGEDRTA